MKFPKKVKFPTADTLNSLNLVDVVLRILFSSFSCCESIYAATVEGATLRLTFLTSWVSSRYNPSTADSSTSLWLWFMPTFG